MRRHNQMGKDEWKTLDFFVLPFSPVSVRYKSQVQSKYTFCWSSLPPPPVCVCGCVWMDDCTLWRIHARELSFCEKIFTHTFPPNILLPQMNVDGYIPENTRHGR